MIEFLHPPRIIYLSLPADEAIDEVIRELLLSGLKLQYAAIISQSIMELFRSREQGSNTYRAIPLQSPYCAAKFAIRGFTDALRSELLGAKSHVHITMVQLPAVNTPQFSWCRAYLERRPRPVAPVFQLEVAARAIAWAADHRRREIDVGASSTLAILANKMFPGLLDRYLVSTIEGQQRSDPLDPTRPDNLFSPVPGDFSAHGEFGSESRDSSPFFWATTHRKWIGTAAAGLALAGVCLLGNRNGRARSASPTSLL